MPLTELAELKNWRTKYGLSQDRLARISGLGVNTIAKIESGEPNIHENTTAKLLKTIEEVENSPEFAALAEASVSASEVASFDISKLKEWRMSYGISQDRFSKLSKLGINTVAKIELGSSQIMPQTLNKALAVVKLVESGAIPAEKVDPNLDHMAGFNPEELRAWRKKRGISQEKLAKMANLGVNTVLKLESGARVEKQTMLALMKTVRDINKSMKAEPVAAPSPKPTIPVKEKVVEKAEAKPAPALKSAPVAKPEPPTDILNLDLKSWRKRFKVSQGSLAKLAELSLNTIIKLESGAKDVQKRSLAKLAQAVKVIESKVGIVPVEMPKDDAASSANDPIVVTSVVSEANEPFVPAIPTPAAPTPVASIPVAPIPAIAPISFATPAITPTLQLSNLDLELINRVILMNTKQKLRLLELIMEDNA